MNPQRRRFLRQIGLGSSAALLSAIGGRLAVQASAPAQTERHLIVNVHGNSWWSRLIRPVDRVSATEWSFNDAFEPLQPLRERTLFVEGLYNPFGGLHGNYGATLCVTRNAAGNRQRVPADITIDRQIAHALSDGVPFSSINFGHPYGNSNASADGPEAVYPAIRTPADVIDQLFQVDQEVDPQAAIRAQMRTSLLDAMAEDIAATQTRLAGSERAAMDQYLGSVRELEEQFEQLQELVCEAPPYDGAAPRNNATIIPELSHFYFQATHVVLACGLTRVVTIANEGVGAEPLQPKYAFDPVNMPTSLHDSINHSLNGLNNDETPDSDAAWAAKSDQTDQLTRLYRWRAQQVADLVSRLNEVPVGGETLADRTMMMWTNTGGGRHHQGHDEIPMLFIGNPDGVFNSGRYERFAKEQRCVSDSFTALAHAMGAPTDSFGDPEHNQGPMPGWLA